ncbi:hypothetical protein BDV10DRAFT_141718 [Aspergillus recurvatus]
MVLNQGHPVECVSAEALLQRESEFRKFCWASFSEQSPGLHYYGRQIRKSAEDNSTDSDHTSRKS